MTEPLRILCIFSTLDRGGAESMCMNLYRRIDRGKIQFDFVKHAPSKGAFEDEIRGLGGNIYEAPRYRLYNHFRYRMWWKGFLTAHPEHRIVHGHFFGISPIYFAVAKTMGRVTVAHAHSVRGPESSIKDRIKYDVILKRIETYSDYCLACSGKAGEWLFPHTKFHVLNNAIETERFRFNADVRRQVRTELDVSPDTMLVGTVNNFTSPKNPDGILDIFKAVHARNPKAKLLWVGDGPAFDHVKGRVHAEALQDSVIMTGVRSDVDRLMQAMDAFILPSRYEGLGIVLIEAQAAGLPCFASDVVPREAGITDLCSFLPLGRPDLWAERICAPLPERRDTSAEIRKAGYDIADTARWLERFYLDIAFQTGGRSA